LSLCSDSSVSRIDCSIDFVRSTPIAIASLPPLARARPVPR
jgi:hypothetical protein